MNPIFYTPNTSNTLQSDAVFDFLKSELWSDFCLYCLI